MRPADTWVDYELIDATNHNRLERWGKTLLIRPDPQIIWKNEEVSPLWARADAIYYRSAKGGGQWDYHKKLPQKWNIKWQDLTLIVSPTGFKHTGVFPEQAVKWAWYARMIRTATIKYTGMNFVLFSRSIGSGNFYILTRHMLPCIAAELAVLASLDTGWAILNISTLSFLGLGVQAPVPEWGAMLNEAKNVMVSNPEQMIVPGIAVVVLVGAFNMLGDCLRDALDPKAVRQ